MDPPAHTPIQPLASRVVAEALGSGFLLIAILGSGIMAETLSPTDPGLQLFEAAAATGGALIALVITFITVSGAHFNPAVTLVERLLGTMSTRDSVAYVGAQLAGGCIGAVAANVMFGQQTGRGWVFISERERSSGGELVAELIATFGLLVVIHGAVRHRQPAVVGVAVGVYIAGAHFFTSSTSFANPMVSIARTLSDTFGGIEPASVPAFVAVQLLGALAAWAVIPFLFHRDHTDELGPGPTV